MKIWDGEKWRIQSIHHKRRSQIGVLELEKEYDMLLKLWASGSRDYINLTSSYLIANSILVAAIAIILKITPIVIAFSVIGIILCIQMYMGLSLLRTQNAYWRRNLKIIEKDGDWERSCFFNEFYEFRDGVYLFKFSKILEDKEQQEKLLKYLEDINYTELSQSMKNAKYSLHDNKRIKITNEEGDVATLEIRWNWCYIIRECYLIKKDKKKIKIGVVKQGDDIYIKQSLPPKGREPKFKLDFAIKHHEACWAHRINALPLLFVMLYAVFIIHAFIAIPIKYVGVAIVITYLVLSCLFSYPPKRFSDC